MKKLFDGNIIRIYYVVIIIFFIANVFCFLKYGYKEYISNDNNKFVVICDNYLKYHTIDSTNKYYYLNDDICNSVVNNKSKSGSAVLFYDKLITNEISSFIFPFFVPIISLFIIIYGLSKMFNSGYIISYLQRKTYKEFILELLKNTYKRTYIIPLILFVFTIISIVISKFNIDPSLDILKRYLGDNIGYMYYKYGFLIFLLYFLTIVINVLFYANIALIVSSYQKNFFVAYIESFVLIYMVWCINFILLGLLLSNFFSIMPEDINLLAIYNLGGVSDIFILFIVSVSYYIISLIVALLCYKNKERIVIVCER